MKKTIIAILGISLFATSCRKMIEGTSGSMKTEYRQAAAFKKIHLEGNIDVFLLQDTTFSVKVEAGENLINYIETSVVNGEMLIYEANNNIANTKPIRVYINCDSLENIVTAGSGNFDAQNIKAATLNFLLIGSGNANLNVAAQQINFNSKGSGDSYFIGNTNYLNAMMQGSGNLKAKFLQSDSVNISSSGSGNTYVTAINSITAAIAGSGNVIYYGNPSTVNSSVTGSGNVSGN